MSSGELHKRLAELYQELSGVHGALAKSAGEDYVDQHESPLGARLHCRLVHSGELAGYRVGRRILAKRVDIDRFIESRRVEPTAPAVGTQDEDEDLLAGIGARSGRAA